MEKQSSSERPEDRNARERRKGLTEEQIKEMELAGGVEGGMQAGTAGGPLSSNSRPKPEKEDRR